MRTLIHLKTNISMKTNLESDPIYKQTKIKM